MRLIKAINDGFKDLIMELIYLRSVAYEELREKENLKTEKLKVKENLKKLNLKINQYKSLYIRQTDSHNRITINSIIKFAEENKIDIPYEFKKYIYENAKRILVNYITDIII